MHSIQQPKHHQAGVNATVQGNRLSLAALPLLPLLPPADKRYLPARCPPSELNSIPASLPLVHVARAVAPRVCTGGPPSSGCCRALPRAVRCLRAHRSQPGAVCPGQEHLRAQRAAVHAARCTRSVQHRRAQPCPPGSACCSALLPPCRSRRLSSPSVSKACIGTLQLCVQLSVFCKCRAAPTSIEGQVTSCRRPAGILHLGLSSFRRGCGIWLPTAAPGHVAAPRCATCSVSCRAFRKQASCHSPCAAAPLPPTTLIRPPTCTRLHPIPPMPQHCWHRWRQRLPPSGAAHLDGGHAPRRASVRPGGGRLQCLCKRDGAWVLRFFGGGRSLHAAVARGRAGCPPQQCGRRRSAGAERGRHTARRARRSRKGGPGSIGVQPSRASCQLSSSGAAHRSQMLVAVGPRAPANSVPPYTHPHPQHRCLEEPYQRSVNGRRGGRHGTTRHRHQLRRWGEGGGGHREQADCSAGCRGHGRAPGQGGRIPLLPCLTLRCPAPSLPSGAPYTLLPSTRSTGITSCLPAHTSTSVQSRSNTDGCASFRRSRTDHRRLTD